MTQPASEQGQASQASPAQPSQAREVEPISLSECIPWGGPGGGQIWLRGSSLVHFLCLQFECSIPITIHNSSVSTLANQKVTALTALCHHCIMQRSPPQLIAHINIGSIGTQSPENVVVTPACSTVHRSAHVLVHKVHLDRQQTIGGRARLRLQ